MSHPLVVHCKKAKYDVYIGRPGLWGNPFPVGIGKFTRDEAVQMYKEWIESRPDMVEAAKRNLKGKVLACWCAPKACHGDVLAKIANEETK